MDTYRYLSKLEVEVFLWRRGSTRVSFDLERAYFTWTEASRWNRNFARSLNNEQIVQLRKACREIDLLGWTSRYNELSDEIIGPWYRAWSIVACIDMPDRQETAEYVFGGRDETPEGFEILSDVVRRICRRDFRVSE